MRAKAKILAVLSGVVVMLVVLVFRREQEPLPRRRCGCLDERFRKLPAFYDWISRTSHCCFGGKLISDLTEFHLAQHMFVADHNRYATNVVELEPYLGGKIPTRSGILNYSVELNQWSVSVDKTSNLPGYYLLTNDKVYFDEFRPATTNDLCLREVKVY